LSAGASPPICLSFAGWLSHRLLSRASASRHLSSCSRRTHPSSTPPLCSCQLVVVSHLFAPPPPLHAPPPHDWLYRCRRRRAGVFAIVAIAIVTLVASRRAGVIALVVVVDDVLRHCRCCRIPLRRRHGHHRCRRRQLRRRHCRRCIVDVVVARRAVTKYYVRGEKSNLAERIV
jgi:hypothetical protein